MTQKHAVARTLRARSRTTRALLMIVASGFVALAAPAGATTRYVQTTGSDNATCPLGSPCQHIDQAVKIAAAGDEILVAAGTYQYFNVGNTCTTTNQSVLCIANKSLTIRGGYTPTTFFFDPPSNLTVIDGGNANRGVFVVSLGPPVRLTMANFTIQNCRVTAPDSDPERRDAFGGGMLVDLAATTLDSIVFKDNTVIGFNLASEPGGDAAGSGLTIRSSGTLTSYLNGLTFQNNTSTAGTGTPRGGFAFGALFIFGSKAEVENSTFTANTATAGNGGTGQDAGFARPDALGAGIAVMTGSTVSITHVTATSNTATGGVGSSFGGGAFGGGLFVEESTVAIQDSTFRSNTVTAASSNTGGVSGGGGVMYFNSNGSIDRSLFILNTAQGGASSGAGIGAGSGGGGGLYLWHNNVAKPQSPIPIRNSLFADNFSANGATGANFGGGGGGLFVQGLTANIDNATFDRNRLGAVGVPQFAGQALVVIEAPGVAATTVNLNNSVISNHTEGALATAVVVGSGNVSGVQNVINFGTGSNFNNTHFSNVDNNPQAPGIINGLATMTSLNPGYVSGGAPSYDYHLTAGSALRGAGPTSTMTVDIDEQPRNDGARDLGADEFVAGTCTPGSGTTDTDFDGIPDTVEAAQGTRPCAKDNDYLGSARLFVMQQYRDFLAREADLNGLYAWLATIGAGTSKAAVTKSFFDSIEFQGTVAPIARLYFAYFNRIPDQAGLDYWTAQYRAGLPLTEISQAFASSAEFIGTYGNLTNSEFVNQVYLNVLGRPADPAGHDYWTAQLDSMAMNRGEVMVGFSESPEYQVTSYNRVFVTLIYYGMLRRVPDQGGFDYWVGQLDGGASALDLINLFFEQIEYRGRFLT